MTQPHVPVANLQAGDTIDEDVYMVIQRDLRTTNNGSLYIHAVLSDRSGQVIARMWNASRGVYESIPNDGLVHINGRVESYKGKPQVIIDGLRSVEPGTANPADFLPCSEYDVDQMWSEAKEILRGIRNEHLLALIAAFINDESFVRGFKRAPAARTNHHAYLGGLLEHTLSLLKLAELILPRYPRVSRDLVLAGIFLHDAGKTAELSYETNFDYTSGGQLVGHIVQAAAWVHERAANVAEATGGPFPPDLLAALQHIIVSHHGRYEFGSPRLPATAEAIMVHYLDNLDAKLNMVFTALDRDDKRDRDWTDWVPALETRVYKPLVT